MPEAVFRFDASPEIGYGHAVRCSALARHLATLGWRTVVATGETVDAPWMKAFDRAVTANGDDEAVALHAAVGGEVDILVVDHYDWDASVERCCRGWARKIIVIDDLANRDHDCDVLCDSNLDPLYYGAHVGATTRLLFGPRYALLRSDFARARHRLDARRAKVERLFVSVGATDPKSLLPRIVEGIELAGFDGAIDVVIARNAPGRATLERILGRTGLKARLHVDAHNVAELMAAADLAIGAAGGTAWERCCLYLPSIVVIAADNQRHVAAGLAAAGAAALIEGDFSARTLAKVLSPLLATNPANMSHRAGRLCDGLGCGRLAEELLFPSSVSLRPTGEGDSDVLLEWQREPVTRRFARDPQVPNSAQHAAWFSRKLNEPGCVFHIIEVEQRPAGFLRLDYRRESKNYEVSIGVGEKFQGKGIAAAALAIIRRLLPWADIRACVQPQNARSIDLFRRSGYVECTRDTEGIWFASAPRSDGMMAEHKARLGVPH
jgi:UDP-2,4-diacetamido-2,4,6-trideoxy-beta-L-altropyranose hydrolase